MDEKPLLTNKIANQESSDLYMNLSSDHQGITENVAGTPAGSVLKSSSDRKNPDTTPAAADVHAQTNSIDSKSSSTPAYGGKVAKSLPDQKAPDTTPAATKVHAQTDSVNSETSSTPACGGKGAKSSSDQKAPDTTPAAAKVHAQTNSNKRKSTFKEDGGAVSIGQAAGNLSSSDAVDTELKSGTKFFIDL